ncbi:MAG: cupin domain-containing protein [Solirubrobacterales bacterium]
MSQEQSELRVGKGFAAANLDGLGEGWGFRKIRKLLDVKEFGVNAIVIPPGLESGAHWHERQEELYFVHQGTIQMTLGENDEDVVVLGPGGVIRVDASTQRWTKNIGEGDAVYVVVGAEGGYVGRDGMKREGDTRVTAG